MGYGFGRDDSGKATRFGFTSVSDWLDSVILSFPAPWKVRDCAGKHYGTEIEDARGLCVLSVWFAFGEPSARQKGNMTDEQWSEYCCDSHWESADQLRVAETIVSLRNYLSDSSSRYGDDERAAPMLRNLIMEHGDWNEDIDDEIKCGGPDRRETSSEHDTALGGMSSGHREWLKERKERACKSCGEIRTAGRSR